MNWKDILKNENDVIYEGRGGRNKVPKDEIKENDPDLYQKLESHFSANPLTNDYDDLKEDWEEDKEFHWEEAFLKYGMDDGYYRELSEEVTKFIESLGYIVRMTHALTHNVYISEVMRKE
tara:strand:+ start:708 stop:1067 length:360 start_codon:yes stop_codon:yes gene_type:complete